MKSKIKNSTWFHSSQLLNPIWGWRNGPATIKKNQRRIHKKLPIAINRHYYLMEINDDYLGSVKYFPIYSNKIKLRWWGACSVFKVSSWHFSKSFFLLPLSASKYSPVETKVFSTMKHKNNSLSYFLNEENYLFLASCILVYKSLDLF